MLGDEIRASGVSEKTPGNILLGAGTIHKGLKYATGGWNTVETCVGATNGGNKFTIKPEFIDVSVDGGHVKVKGLTQKVGETATMEVNVTELTPEMIKAAVIGKDGASDAEGYNVIESKPNIEEGDYWENIAFVGKTVSGRPIIVIIDNALCTSGLDIEGKDKDSATGKYTFEGSQELTEDLTVVPYHIYYQSSSDSEKGA
jgi:hypothetical protein